MQNTQSHRISKHDYNSSQNLPIVITMLKRGPKLTNHTTTAAADRHLTSRHLRGLLPHASRAAAIQSPPLNHKTESGDCNRLTEPHEVKSKWKTPLKTSNERAKAGVKP
ncbi:hypothetical protein M758_UG269900 [Ceratodon purpureus]|nr:hypothetical protein M758_UG269900 [Ceratodon purpureus]